MRLAFFLSFLFPQPALDPPPPPKATCDLSLSASRAHSTLRLRRSLQRMSGRPGRGHGAVGRSSCSMPIPRPLFVTVVFQLSRCSSEQDNERISRKEGNGPTKLFLSPSSFLSSIYSTWLCIRRGSQLPLLTGFIAATILMHPDM